MRKETRERGGPWTALEETLGQGQVEVKGAAENKWGRSGEMGRVRQSRRAKG